MDKAAGTITVGAGQRLGEVYLHAWNQAQSMIAAGSCPGNGASGFHLGGGFGYYSRRFGYGSQNLVSAKAVSVDGRKLTLSETSNPSLFWAVRGGGGGQVVVYEVRIWGSAF